MYKILRCNNEILGQITVTVCDILLILKKYILHLK